MMKRLILPFLLIFGSLLILGFTKCQKLEHNSRDENTLLDSVAVSADSPKKPSSDGQIVALVPEVGPNQFYTVMFDDVRIRETPSLNAKILTTTNTGEQVKNIMEMEAHSENSDTVVLRGVRYTAHWYRIVSPGGHDGWIYGAAIGRYLSAEKV